MALNSNVKTFLTHKNVIVSDAWIAACIEFVTSENPGINNPNKQQLLKDKVYEQWLYSDITEIASSSLPFNLKDKKYIQINGNYALQVNKIIDIGTSSYSQLQNIRKDDIQNESISADKPHVAAWEPKPSRMLFLELTDGTTCVSGMEYEIIPSLNANMPPGFKILVSGKITIRRGVLFLNKTNCKVLGGNVESFEVSNALENVICRKLGLEETEQPRKLSAVPIVEVAPSQTSQYYPSQVSSTYNRRVQQHNRNNNINVQNLPPPTPLNIEMDDLDDADFMDEEMDAVLSQIENSNSLQTQNNHSNTQNANNQPQARANTYFDDSDDDLFLSIENPTTTNNKSNQNKSATNNNKRFLNRSENQPHSSSNNLPNSFNRNSIKNISNNSQENSQKYIGNKTNIQTAVVTPTRPVIKKLPVSSVVQNNPPFTYLCLLPKNPTEEKTYEIKGFIMTLTSKLEPNMKEGVWKLKVKINDGTASAEVIIHDQVLTKMIGMTVHEVAVKKAEANGDKMKLKELMKCVSGCQHKLISLCGILHIRISAESDFPILTNVSDVDRNHIQQLESRSNLY